METRSEPKDTTPPDETPEAPIQTEDINRQETEEPEVRVAPHPDLDVPADEPEALADAAEVLAAEAEAPTPEAEAAAEAGDTVAPKQITERIELKPPGARFAMLKKMYDEVLRECSAYFSPSSIREVFPEVLKSRELPGNINNVLEATSKDVIAFFEHMVRKEFSMKLSRAGAAGRLGELEKAEAEALARRSRFLADPQNASPYDRPVLGVASSPVDMAFYSTYTRKRKYYENVREQLESARKLREELEKDTSERSADIKKRTQRVAEHTQSLKAEAQSIKGASIGLEPFSEEPISGSLSEEEEVEKQTQGEPPTLQSP